MTSLPRRGDIWLADLNPVRANEQAGRRPVLVVSSNSFNAWPIQMAMVVPLTSSYRPFPHRVPVTGAGLERKSFARPEDLRSVSTERFTRRIAVADEECVDQVAGWLRDLLDL